MVVEPPEKKHAQVKLDLLQGEQVNIKKKIETTQLWFWQMSGQINDHLALTPFPVLVGK